MSQQNVHYYVTMRRKIDMQLAISVQTKSPFNNYLIDLQILRP